MSASLPTSTFSTHQLRPDESVNAWRSHLAEVYFQLDVTTPDRDRIDGRLDRRILENIKISSLSASKQRMRRTAEATKLDKIESYVFIAPIMGTFASTQRNIDKIVSYGQVFMLASAEFHEVTICDDAQMVCLEIPKVLLSNRIPQIDRFAAETFSDPLIVNLLRNAAVSILHLDSTAEVERIENICLDLIEVAISDAKTDLQKRRTSKLLDEAMFDRLMQIIHLRKSDRDFGLDECAAACSVSKRHIQSILHARGTTFGRELMSARLNAAGRLLKSPRGRTISQIAAMCGFSSHAYFATCYRQRFGNSPRDDHHA